MWYRRTPKDAAEILCVAKPYIMRREGQIMCRATITSDAYEHPLVDPHVLHFMHVPLRTSVKFRHSPQASPS